MKPCRKQNQSAVRPAQPIRPVAVQRPTPIPETNVRRYVHPIRTVKPPPRDTSEEMLSYVLEALSRQSEQLNEILRRLDGDNSDTM
ncbi:MAG: hypothetical protein K2N78_08545 [Oscillospiraceae bacterium]|nr:hypothetical protein [Oscillospiraceae bacterium]